MSIIPTTSPIKVTSNETNGGESRLLLQVREYEIDIIVDADGVNIQLIDPKLGCIDSCGADFTSSNDN